MLTLKAWKPEAMVRFLLSVFVCIFAGSVVVGMLAYRGNARWQLYTVSAASLGFLLATLIWLRRPWVAERFGRRVAGAMVCFYAGLLLCAWAGKLLGAPAHSVQSVGQMVVAALSFQGATVVLVVLFLREHQMSWADAFGLENQWRHALLLGFVVAGIFLPVGATLQVGSARLITWTGEKVARYHVHLTPEPQEAIQTFEKAVTWWDRIALAAITIILAPVAEELLFRGLLYAWIKQLGFPRLAWWGTSVLFALFHLNLMTFLPLFVLALTLARLYERTDNLLASITAHACFNGFNLVMLYMFQEQLRKLQ